MPPMEFNDGNIPPMNGQEGSIPPMEDPNITGGNLGDANSFDTNFDAGVDADENTDPKKYIQQLTGKLSQSLRKYNNNLPNPEVDLNKYVAGMILKQATEGLSDEDKKEIVGKVSDNEIENGANDDTNGEISSIDNLNMMNDNGQRSMMENNNYRSIVNEIFQELTQPSKKIDSDIAQRPIKNIGFRKKPFTAPKIH